jgi:hypothetical protein
MREMRMKLRQTVMDTEKNMRQRQIKKGQTEREREKGAKISSIFCVFVLGSIFRKKNFSLNFDRKHW